MAIIGVPAVIGMAHDEHGSNRRQAVKAHKLKVRRFILLTQIDLAANISKWCAIVDNTDTTNCNLLI